MSVFMSGHYTVNFAGSKEPSFVTITGDLDAFQSAAAQAVEASRRDNSRRWNVFYVEPDSTHITKITRVGFASRGRWYWRDK
jgi:hypothetical protein